MNWLTRRLLLETRPTHADGTDDRLLGAFVDRRDGEAFETLVNRHGPMVWGVCRRITGSREDAEDSFQAVFLILARKASSIAPRAMLAGWLYGVACRAAWQARRSAARRRAVEQPVARLPEPAVAQPTAIDTRLAAVIDEEVARLPDRYRMPAILCILQGLTRREAALRLGWPEGSVAGRLSRARKILADRLARRGVAPVAAVGLAGLIDSVLPASLIAAVVRGTIDFGAAPATVVVLTEEVLRTMIWAKTKWVVATVLAAGLVCTGVSVSGQKPAEDPRRESVTPREEALPLPNAPPRNAASVPRVLSSAKVRDLQKARLEALTKLAAELEKQFLAARGVRIAELVEVRRQLAEAELELAERLKEKEAVYARWVTAGKKLEAVATALSQAGQGSEADLLAARAARLQAEIAQARWQESSAPDRVGRIKIEGNTKTEDSKIVDLLDMYPGQILQYPRVEAARLRLEKAGFKDTEILVEQNDLDSNFKDIVVRVREK